MVSGCGVPLTSTVALVAAIWWRAVELTVTESDASTAATAALMWARSAPAAMNAPRSMSPEAPAEQSSQAMRISLRPSSHGERTDARGEHPSPETVVDVHHRHSRRTRVEHPEEGGQPTERGAVPHRRRYGDERYADQSADDTRQRTLHAGDHDQAVRSVKPLPLAEHSVQAGHANVRDDVDCGTEDPSRRRRLRSHRSVRRSSRHHSDGPVQPRRLTEDRRTPDRIDQRVRQGRG